MPDKDDLLDQISILNEKIRLLEIENDLLSARAEESVLLGQIVEQINTSTEIPHMVNSVLERISLVKDIPFCGLLVLDGRTVEIISFYLSYAHDELSVNKFLIDIDLAEDLKEGAFFLRGEDCIRSGISFSTPSIDYLPDAMLFIPSRTRWNDSALFLFAGNQMEERLSNLRELLSRVVDIVSARIDNFSLLEELWKFNVELDRKVDTRTQDLLEANVMLQNEIAEKRKAEKRLQDSEKRYRHLVESVTDYIYSVQLEDGKPVKTSHGLACLKVTGYSPEEYANDPDLWHRMIYGEDRQLVMDQVENVMAGRPVKPIEHRLIHKNGEIKWVRREVVPLINDTGRVTGYDGLVSDISEQKRLEIQLRQIQKMEAIGTLTGGIAHDFNNILTAIIGYATLLMMKMDDDDPLKQNVSHILSSSEKAAYLTQSLLAFSRKQVMNPYPLKLNDLLQSTKKLLRRLIGEDIELRTKLLEEELIVVADTVQIEQVLMNLATNARDAMPSGGILTITTDKIKMDDEYVRAHGYGETGNYALITVSDNGCGMPHEALEKIFEPFYTTKEKGKGTGLGLSITYGIVKQHNGFLNVYSEEGEGTVFKIYLPLVERSSEKAEEKEITLEIGGNETILLAEDDDDARELTKCILEEYGYKVILAVDGEDAVRKFREKSNEVDLLLFDVVMPKKNGREAYEEIHEISPDTRVLFVSGYTADIIKQKGVLNGDMPLLMKPVSPSELLKKIRALVERQQEETN